MLDLAAKSELLELQRFLTPHERAEIERLINHKRPALDRLKLHAGQQQIVAEAKRFNVVACGRRFGKTLLGIDRAIETVLDGYPVGWFSPTYKMLEDVWGDLKTATAPLSPKTSEQEHRIDFSGVVKAGAPMLRPVLEMWSLDRPDAARGRKYKRVLVDEAAMISSLGYSWQAVIRPMLTDLRGDAYFFSTPKGHNYFWELYLRGEDAAQADWACWSMPTGANPFINTRRLKTRG
jgi:hypothetical protein